MGLLEGEEREQEIENLGEKIMKENFPNLVKEIETINNNQEEMKNTISEIKHPLEGITSSLDEAED